MKKIEIDEAKLRDLHQKDLTINEMAAYFGCHRRTIDNRLQKLGLHKERTGTKRGDRHPEWKGGRKLVGRYWYIYMPDHPNCTKQRYVAEHRLVMEAHLNRLLSGKEVVHHINGDPSDNQIGNLMLFGSNGEHLKHELKDRIPNWSKEGKIILEKVRQRIATLRKSGAYD